MNFLPAFMRRRSRLPVPAPLGAEEKWVMFADAFKTDNQWFQKALDSAGNATDVSTNTALNSCVNILSQEIASLHAHHWRVDMKTGAREKVIGPVSRVLRKPNPYQSSSDFWLYQVRALLFCGNLIGAAVRNGKTEVVAIHPLPPRQTQARVDPDSGAVYYSPASFEDGLFNPKRALAAEDVLHVRINCNKHPLVGETPIASMTYAGLTGNAIQQATARFHSNMARPSGVMMTPKPLTKKQVDELRQQFEDVSTGANIGRTPVLHSELKWEPVTMTATDAETIASYNLTVADIAMAHRIPLFMLGDMSKANFKNVETLMRLFYTSSLRFYLEHIENALNDLFELDGEREYIEFDIESGLLRGDFRERVEAYTKAIQGGLLKPDEARKREEYAPAEGGGELYMQRQMVPLSAIKVLLEAEAKRAAAPPPAPPPAPAEEENEDEVDEVDEDDEEDSDEKARSIANEILRRISQ